MKRFLSVLTAGLLLIASGAPVAARSHRSEATPPPPAPPAPALELPASPQAAQPEPAPASVPNDPLYAVPAPPAPVVIPPSQTRKYWELSAVGGGIIGGVYVLSVLVGSLSYAGFYQGQWGWFVPLVGPALTMGNVGDQLCPCFTKQMYTYGFGTVFTIATIGGMVPLILGGILNKTVSGNTSKIQLVPTVARDSTGLQLVGRF